ncbi:uncharacterized protein ISCGN_021292 [Ixodes scapularis]
MAKKPDKAKPDRAKPDVPNVACGKCERWCFLMETPFGSVEEAADKEYQCRICVNADEVKGMLEMMRGELGKEREARERMELQMKEAREGLRDEKGENKGVDGGELGGQRKGTHVQCGDCKKSVDIEDTRFDSVDEAGMTEFMCRMCVLNARQDRLEAENTELMARIVKLEAELERERSERQTVDDKLAKANEKLADLEVVLLPSDITANDTVVESDGGRTYKEALKPGGEETGKGEEKSKGKAPALVESRQDMEGNVIIAGDSNMERCRRAIAERVKGDARVRIGVLPGQTMRAVIEGVKDKLWETKEGQNLVVIAGGLNDVLRGNGGGVGKQLRRGVMELRATSDNVEIHVCTVPEVRDQGVHIERAVVAANRDIRRLGREMGFGVMDMNWEVYKAFEFVPCSDMGLSVRFASGHAVVTHVQEGSIAAEDDQVQVGDVLDELYGEAINGRKRGAISALLSHFEGLPVYASFVKSSLPDRSPYPPVEDLLRSLGMANVYETAGNDSSEEPTSDVPLSSPSLILGDFDRLPVNTPQESSGYPAIYLGKWYVGNVRL